MSIGPVTTRGVRAGFKAAAATDRETADALRRSWQARIAKAQPHELETVKAACAKEEAAHKETARYRGHIRAAMITSAADWVPVADRPEVAPPKSPEQRDARVAAKILTEAYRLLGQKGRQLAAMRGEVFSEKHVEQSKLDIRDVDAIAANMEGVTPGAKKRAQDLLARHVFTEDGAGRSLATEQARAHAAMVVFDEVGAAMVLDLEEHIEKLEAAEAKNKMQIEDKKERMERFVVDQQRRERRDAKNRWQGPKQDLRRDKTKAGQRSIETVGGVAVLVIKD